MDFSVLSSKKKETEANTPLNNPAFQSYNLLPSQKMTIIVAAPRNGGINPSAKVILDIPKPMGMKSNNLPANARRYAMPG